MNVGQRSAAPKARSIHAIFSCFSMSPVRKSLVPASRCLAAVVSRSSRSRRITVSWSPSRSFSMAGASG